MKRYSFRGKRLDNGEWALGNLISWNDREFIHYDELDSKNRWREVEPLTVGQWTGLYDNDGIPIFEGDTIKVTSRKYPDDSIVGDIRFGNYRHISASLEYPCGDVGFYVDWRKEDLPTHRNDILYWVNNRYVSVVGNIHDEI